MHYLLVVSLSIISASLSINIASISANGVDLSPTPLLVCVCVYVGRSVCLESVLYITARWIRMLFRMLSRVGRGIGVLDGSGDRRRGRSSFGGEFGVSQMTFRRTCYYIGVMYRCHTTKVFLVD